MQFVYLRHLCGNLGVCTRSDKASSIRRIHLDCAVYEYMIQRKTNECNATRRCRPATTISETIYMSLPFVYPPFTGELCPVFFSALRVANSALSISDATVSTPPTMAHVLQRSG